MNENQRTVTLPTIPKEVADLITNLRAAPPVSNARILGIATDPTAIESYRDILRSIPFDTLLSALVNGYAVEKSAEELEREAHDKIREKHAEHDIRALDYEEYSGGFADGIEFTLNTLGIKIEGVNA